MWEYIRKADLQDPKDRRKIRNDEKMFRVFKCKTMNMMHIAKKLSPHLKKYSELVVGDGDGEAAAGSATEGEDGVDHSDIRAGFGFRSCNGPLCSTAVRVSKQIG